MSQLSYHEMAPPANLKHLIKCFWTLSGDGADGEGDAVIPDGMPELVLNFGDPFRRLRPGSSPQEQPRAILVGQISEPLRLEAGRTVDLLGIRFWPGGAAALYRGPMSEITDCHCELAAVSPPVWSQIACTFQESRGRERIRLAAQGLAKLARNTSETALMRIARSVVAGSTRANVDDLAGGMGIGPRQLGRRFGSEVGLGPKLLLRIGRLQKFLRRLEATPTSTISLARLAAECGYYDQSHLTRDFGALVGSAPGAYLKANPWLARQFIGQEEHLTASGVAR